jgi:hypothetical protein
MGVIVSVFNLVDVYVVGISCCSLRDWYNSSALSEKVKGIISEQEHLCSFPN